MFWQTYSVPTDEQFALLGKSVTAWGIIDHQTTILLSRLAAAPDFLGLALTDDLGFAPRLKAIKNLVDIHRRRYQAPRITESALAQADDVVRLLDASKQERNRIAHAIWMRYDEDQLFNIRLRGRQHADGRDDGAIISNDELRLIVQRAEELIATLEALILLLPEVSETR